MDQSSIDTRSAGFWFGFCACADVQSAKSKEQTAYVRAKRLILLLLPVALCFMPPLTESPCLPALVHSVESSSRFAWRFSD